MSEVLTQLALTLNELGRSDPDPSKSLKTGFALELAVSEARRLQARLDAALAGRAEVTDGAELQQFVRWFVGSADSPLSWAVTIHDSLFSGLTEGTRADGLDLVRDGLDLLAATKGELAVHANDHLALLNKGALLRTALHAAAKGLDVRVISDPELREPTFAIEIVVSDQSRALAMSAPVAGKSARAWSIEIRPAVEATLFVSRGAPGREYPLHLLASTPSTQDPENLSEAKYRASIVDLFGDLISLRDLEPRTTRVRGLDALRSVVSFPSRYIPRKNETEYSEIVRLFANDLAIDNPNIIYIGDTVLNDGSVVRNLAAQSPTRVFGFLCNEKGFSGTDEFILGSIYFGRRWTSLVEFVRQARSRKIEFDSNTVAFFDLDQTVYAAKGRDDEPLRDARWEAIFAFLRDTIPEQRFDPKRVEGIYRQFDQDHYHSITRDNMDYVVLLVLAVASGLCEAAEIDAIASSDHNSISYLTELLHQRALARQSYDGDVDRILDVIRAVHYNTLANDQTPCKEFREYECRSTAARMRAEGTQNGAIVLNREVVDFISFLRERNVHLFAVSDRPVEAAVVETDDQQREDLMSIRMSILGMPILKSLRALS